ncbi:primase C-terminal domain-containing protein [Peptococcaceae bacterium 1198_IL3148]
MTSQKEILDIVKFFLEDQLTEKPKRLRVVGAKDNDRKNDLGYVFTAEVDVVGELTNHKSCRTYSTLKHRLSNFFTSYWTPNTFFHWKYRNKESLRWINAIVVDIDKKIPIVELLTLIDAAGLPGATLINRTPSGGWHVYWKIDRVRAFSGALKQYEDITKTIAYYLGADDNALTAERYFRVPKDVQFFSKENSYDFETLINWLATKDVPATAEKNYGQLKFISKGILNHPAIRKLLKGVEEGKRDNTAFTLALVYKVEGYSKEQTLQALEAWNVKNTPMLSYAQLRSKVKSAFKSKYKGPKSSYVTELSGIPFTYRVIKNDEHPKERKRKEYVKLSTIKSAIIYALKKVGGQLSISQSKLAKVLGVSLRSLQKAISELRRKNKLISMSTGTGKSTVTVYKLCTNSGRYESKEIQLELFQNLQIPFLTQILLHMDVVVGGNPFPDSISVLL